MTPIISTLNLSHIYSPGTPFEKLAINDVSFDAYKGEIIGIIGHTGSGKSTFIQHLNGLLKPTSGSVLFNGTNIHSDKNTLRSIRHKVGLVFQYPEYQLFEETLYKDIAFGPRNMKLSESEIEIRVRGAADFVGIPHELLDKSPFELSGGQKRRAAIAGVIAMHPDVLILDEPTAGLDPRGRDQILANIRSYHDALNSTIILVTHSMDEIARFTDRIVVFNDASIVMRGSPSDIFERGDELIKIGLGIPDVTRVFLRLRHLGLPLPHSVFTLEHAVSSLLAIKEDSSRA